MAQTYSLRKQSFIISLLLYQQLIIFTFRIGTNVVVIHRFNMKRFLSILTKPYLLALVPALLVIIALPDMFKKYKFEPLSHRLYEKGSNIAYADLDSDGNSEFIHINSFQYRNLTYVTVNTPEMITVNEWDFHGKQADARKNIFTGDYNKDSLLEVYVFTKSNDSLFVGYCEPMKDTILFTRQKFITCYPGNSSNFDAPVKLSGFEDADDDGYDEAYFFISAGFELQPRKMFYWDIRHDSIHSSPLMGAPVQGTQMYDLTGDGKKEILCDCYAPGNYKKGRVPYEDSSCWSMVFTTQLNFLFPPIEYPGRLGSVSMVPVTNGKVTNIVALYSKFDTLKQIATLQLIDSKGNIKAKKDLIIDKNDPNKSRLRVLPGNNSHFLLFRDFKVYSVMNNDLASVRDIKAHGISTGFYQLADIDGDGEDEMIVLGNDTDNQYILDDDLYHPTALPLRIFSNSALISVNKKIGLRPTFTIMAGDDLWEYRYYKNPWVYAKYPLYLGIYLIMVLMVWGLQMAGRAQLKKRLMVENKISALQMMAVQKQFDPHFTFNSLNVVIESLRRQNPEEAVHMVRSFAKMLRHYVESGDKIVRTLEQELDLTVTYLDLEKSRFGDRFNYSVSVGDTVDRSGFIPKMCLLTYVENAVKHGIQDLERGGFIDISIIKENNYTVIAVRDNGPGINNTGKKKNSTGRGLSIMEQSYILFNTVNKNKISWEITDLGLSGDEATGTLVQVKVPDNINYKIY